LPNIKIAGDKGAEAHTVSEESRIRLTQMLLKLRDSSNDEDKLEFKSDLSNTEQKFMVSFYLPLEGKDSFDPRVTF
jgi:hypothetical protein